MTRVLLITKGHPFEREPFFDMFDALEGVEWTHVEQPAARALFDPAYAADYDVFVCYDMPGIRFGAGGPAFEDPPQTFRDNFDALTRSGKPLVFLHHALAGWPAWPQWAEVLGGRFLYVAGDLRGEPRQDSGYRHAVTHTISRVGDHPVTAGLPAQFEMTDELYLAEVFESDVVPLLRSDHAFEAGNFYSAERVVREGKMYSNEGWDHAPGSNLVGWIKHWQQSPIVYLQGGDDPVAYANPHFRQLLGNAIAWAVSDDARAFVASRSGTG